MLRSSPRFDYKWIKCDIQVVYLRVSMSYSAHLRFEWCFHTDSLYRRRTCQVVEWDCEGWRDRGQPGGEKWLGVNQPTSSLPADGTRMELGVRARDGAIWRSHPRAHVRAVCHTEPRELPNTIFLTTETAACNNGTILFISCKEGHW